jgi:hypothetical protein
MEKEKSAGAKISPNGQAGAPPLPPGAKLSRSLQGHAGVVVAAQTDRGTCTLTPQELSAFCRRHGIVGPMETRAATGQVVAELVEQMKSVIPRGGQGRDGHDHDL